MPVYEYVPDDGACERCAGRFAILERLSDPESRTCPDCGKPCHRVPSAPALAVGGAHRLKESHLARHGFTQYRRLEKGRYEKVTGDGPPLLTGD